MKDFDSRKELARYMMCVGLIMLVPNLLIVLAIIYIILKIQ